MPKLSDWFLDDLTREIAAAPPPPPPKPRPPKPRPPAKPRHDEFEVICDTVFGPLPKLTPRDADRGCWSELHGVGAATPGAWFRGRYAKDHHRLGYIAPEWRD